MISSTTDDTLDAARTRTADRVVAAMAGPDALLLPDQETAVSAL
jgi:hypothetical protein